MSRNNSLTLALAAFAVFVACSSSPQGPGPSPSPSAAGTVNAYDTTNAQPQNCVQKTEYFRYYNTLTGQPMPWVQSYTPYPLSPHIHYYTVVPTGAPSGSGPATPIAVEVSPGASAPPNTTVYDAVPVVPVVDWGILGTLPYGPKDQGTVTVIPSGSLSNELQWDIAYRAQQDAAAATVVNAAQAGTNPTAAPTNAADAARDTQFQADGLPAVTALARGAGPDDRYFSGGIPIYFGIPFSMNGNHPRIAACNWLQNVKYDLILTIIRKRMLAPAAYASLQANLQQQQAPSNLIDTAGWVAYEKDTYVVSGIQPELWPPSLAQGFADSDVLNNSIAYQPVKKIATVQLPTPDQTTGP